MIKGSMVALVTPMSENGHIDYDDLYNLIELHVVAGTSAIVVGGTTGEASTLSIDEQAELIARIVEACRNKITVVAGIGSNCTSEAIELAAMAKDKGADAGLAVAPYYVRPNQAGIIQHFEAVTRATSFPQILYNIPFRTGVDIHDNTILTLAENPLIIGLKDATNDFARAANIITAAPPHFACYSGDDSTTLAFMLLGGHGTISVAANIVPKAMSRLCSLALDGKMIEARALNAQLIPIYKGLSVDTNPIPVKYAMTYAGLISNVLRLPLVKLDEERCLRVNSILETASKDLDELRLYLPN